VPYYKIKTEEAKHVGMVASTTGRGQNLQYASNEYHDEIYGIPPKKNACT
jgi:hypothetical protein